MVEVLCLICRHVLGIVKDRMTPMLALPNYQIHVRGQDYICGICVQDAQITNFDAQDRGKVTLPCYLDMPDGALTRKHIISLNRRGKIVARVVD